jgi:microcystin-dependent protein
MAQPYIGEIRMFAGTFAPAGWAFCNGQQIPISQNDTLFILIGTTYGGDGEQYFNLPNLQSRVPLHFGNGPDGVTYPLAQTAGVESVTLTTQQIPIHNHALIGSLIAANTGDPTNKVFGTSGQLAYLIEADPEVQLNAQAVSPVGGSQPHENCQPFLCINYIISLYGLFPQPT